MNQLIDQNGQIIPLTSLTEWEDKRAQILEAAQEIMGLLPGDEKRCPLAIDLVEEVDCGTYIRQMITYTAEPGDRAQAYLLIPKQALDGRACPAVLCPHPTHADVGIQNRRGTGRPPQPGLCQRIGRARLCHHSTVLSHARGILARCIWSGL